MATQSITYSKVTRTEIVRADVENVRRRGEAYPHFHPLNPEDRTSHIERPKTDAVARLARTSDTLPTHRASAAMHILYRDWL